MYKISVPVINLNVEYYGKEKYNEYLKRFNAERVFFAISCDGFRGKQRDEELKALKENCRWFREQGYEVGAWFWTFMVRDENDYTHICSPQGKTEQNQVCPTDKAFTEMKGDFMAAVAECEPDIIMFDDDFRYGYHGIGFGCLCENHLKMISDILGETVTREQMAEKILCGGPNKYRDAFIKANGDAFREFAKEMRKQVDGVNPNIRLGFCACLNSWDLDGVTPDELSTILAGNTKPFYRLIGAPYWANNRAFDYRLSTLLEFERFQSSQRKNKEIEIFGEGDVFPRPRFQTPATYLECFDTVLRACGSFDGILKYGIDYTSSPDYETGYVLRHEKNRPIYEKIEEFFGGKETIGVRVYKKGDILKNMTVPKVAEGNHLVQHGVFPYESRLLAYNGIPTIYEGDGFCGIAFGEDIAEVSENAFKNGLIIDAKAAQILTEKGVDCGVAVFGDTVKASLECYGKEKVCLYNGADVRNITVKENAEIVSEFETENGKIPAAFTYENENGQKFFVLCYDGFYSSEELCRQYKKAEQLADAVLYLCGQKLPVTCFGNPDLYTVQKEKDGVLAVGLWNFFQDSILMPKLIFGKDFEILETVNCEVVKSENNGVYLSEIPAYGFAGLLLKEKKK